VDNRRRRKWLRRLFIRDMASTLQMFFKEWREATQEKLGRKVLLRRTYMKIMVTTTRFYFTECTEAVREEKSRSKVFTRLESK